MVADDDNLDKTEKKSEIEPDLEENLLEVSASIQVGIRIIQDPEFEGNE